MNGTEPSLIALSAIAETGGELRNFPLGYQILSVVFTALVIWTFAIGRDPRAWRRLYQAKFSRSEEFSINRNKRLDEKIRKYCPAIAVVFIIIAAWAFVMGVTYKMRHTQRPPAQQTLSY